MCRKTKYWDWKSECSWGLKKLLAGDADGTVFHSDVLGGRQDEFSQRSKTRAIIFFQFNSGGRRQPYQRVSSNSNLPLPSVTRTELIKTVQRKWTHEMEVHVLEDAKSFTRKRKGKKWVDILTELKFGIDWRIILGGLTKVVIKRR